MTSQPTTDQPNEADRMAPDAPHHRGLLNAVIDRAADFTRLIHEQAVLQVEAAKPAPIPTEAIADLTIAFDRVARTMRRCMLMGRKLAEPLPEAVDPAQSRAAARRRIIRAVEDAIQREAPDDDAEAALQGEFLERLDAPDLDEAIADRPVGEIIADICRDLGIEALPGTHPWKRRTPADIAELCARAAALPPDPPGRWRSTRP